MPKPDLAPIYSDTNGTAFRDIGKGYARIGFIPPEQQATQREVLKREGSVFEAGTELDIVSPGQGWLVSGDLVTVLNVADLLTNIQVYRNGQLLACGAELNSDADVYFVDVNTIAFAFSIRSEEVLQIWKNFYS